MNARQALNNLADRTQDRGRPEITNILRDLAGLVNPKGTITDEQVTLVADVVEEGSLPQGYLGMMELVKFVNGCSAGTEDRPSGEE